MALLRGSKGGMQRDFSARYLKRIWLRLREFGCVWFTDSISASSGRFTSRRWIHIARVRFLVLNLEHQGERHWLPNYLADSRHFAIGCTNGFITPPRKVMSFSSCTECMHGVSSIRRYVCWQGLEVLSNNIIAVHLSSSLILDCNCHLRISWWWCMPLYV